MNPRWIKWHVAFYFLRFLLDVDKEYAQGIIAFASSQGEVELENHFFENKKL